MINQDLQASYQIISLLERSKANSEAIIDRLPDFFAIIDGGGRILKGNETAASRMGVNIESLLGMSVSKLFKEETWKVFQSYMEHIRLTRADSKPVEFELPIDSREGEERICYWTLATLESGTRHKAKLFCLIGRDITLLRSYQKQLAEIFASIPLGILTANRDGIIDDTFSAYTQWLLGTDHVAGRKLQDLLFEPCRDYMDSQAREGWTNLLNFAQFGTREFDMLSETFPRQFFYPVPHAEDTPEKGRYLGMKVQSFSHGNKVSGVLIILEDRTAIVEAEKADEKQKLLLDMSLERALQIKKCDPDLLSVVMDDLKHLFSQLGDAVFSKSRKNFLNILHSIKGNARLAGFTELMKLAHFFESLIREAVDKDPKGEFDWNMVHSPLDDLRAEWKEILSIATILDKSDAPPKTAETAPVAQTEATSSVKSGKKSLTMLFRELKGVLPPQALPQAAASLFEDLESHIHELSMKPLTSLEPVLRHNAQTTAETLRKKVRLVFDWEKSLSVDETLLPDIRTCLLHLLNNAIDHGIEMPDKRMEARKPLNGVLRINAYTAGERLVFTVEDDGRGLDTEKIQNHAVHKGLVTVDEASRMTPEETFELLFRQGFSTADKVTEVSGRGVGLDAVREIAEAHQGEVIARQGKTHGAAFQFHFRMEKN